MAKINELINKIYENPVEIIDFYKEIVKEDVFIISAKLKTDGIDYCEVKKEPTELTLYLIEKQDKTPILPVFSTLEDLELSNIEDREILKIPFKDVLFAINDLQIVINPYSERSKEFSLLEIEDLRNGSIFNSDMVPNKLYHLLKNVVDTQQGYEAFYKEIYKADIFVFVAPSDDSENSQLNFVSLVNKETNEEIVPVFCCLEDILQLNQDLAIQKIPLIEVLKLFHNKDIKIVLNPNSQYSKVFIKEELDDIISGKILEKKIIAKRDIAPINLSHKENLTMRKPQNNYDSLIGNTLNFFEKHGKVYVAYLVEVLLDNDYEPLMVVDVDIDGEFVDFVNELNTHYNECNELSAPLISRFKFNDKVSDQLIEYMKPFYLKK